MIESQSTQSSGLILGTLDADSAPFTDFNTWFAELLTQIKPAYIVGIARGAVRLLQLQNIQRVIGDIPILADYSLPFLADAEIEGKRILLFDDSVIFGSTLSRIREHLLARGAIVFCAAYIIDRCSFLGEPDPLTNYSVEPSLHREIPVRANRVLWPDEIRRHHNKLINSIFETKRDYNLDFPKIRISTSNYSIGDIPYLLKLLGTAEMFSSLHDVSSRAAAASGVYRYTALLEPSLRAALSRGGLSFRPYSKARMIFIPEAAEIHLTPMPQLTVTREAIKNLEFEDPALQQLWQKLTVPHTRDDEFYPKAAFRLLTFFIGAILGESVTRTFISSLDSKFVIDDCVLVDDDIIPALGERNSDALKEIWFELRRLEQLPGIASINSPANVDSREYVNETLIAAIGKKWERAPNLQPHDGELPYEILGKVFLTLRAVTDSDKCRRDNPDASRLEVGLTYEAIRLLLERYCAISMPSNTISTAIDMCVDNGQAVPKVICEDGVWFRAFYSGEAEDAHSTFQLKDAFHRGYSEFLEQRNVRALSEFDTHKLSATLRDIFPWLPISTKPFTFGRFATVGHSQQGLIGWLVNRGTGPLKLSTDDQGRRILLVNETYESCVDPSWDPDINQKFFDAFQYLATAFSRLKDSAPKLLLSTCRTQRHTYNAVAIEAYNWVEHDSADFHRLISAVRLNESGELRDAETALDSIYWCTRFLSEAREKHDIFHRKFDKTKGKLAKAFKRQGKPALRFWEYTILQKNLLDSSTHPEIELKFTTLRPLLTQMRHLTSYMVGILLEVGLLNEADLRQRFERERVSLEYDSFAWLTEYGPKERAALFNENIERNQVAGLSIERTKLTTTISATGESLEPWYSDTLKTVRTCFTEISSSLRNFAPHYKTLETDFPFSPENDSRVLYDDSEEMILRDHFVLTVEIIKSTDSVQTNSMKDFVVSTLKQFSGVYFDKSGNDAFLACCVDARTLIDIARIIMKEGETLKTLGGNFGGTRKGISLGTFRYVVDSQGHPRVSDAVIPNVLPRAFGMLEGLDTRYSTKPDERNGVIIVDDSIVTSVAPLLNRTVEKKDRFMAKGKHFRGRCYSFVL